MLTLFFSLLVLKKKPILACARDTVLGWPLSLRQDSPSAHRQHPRTTVTAPGDVGSPEYSWLGLIAGMHSRKRVPCILKAHCLPLLPFRHWLKGEKNFRQGYVALHGWWWTEWQAAAALILAALISITVDGKVWGHLIYLLQPHVGRHQLVLLILGQHKVERPAIPGQPEETNPTYVPARPILAPMEPGAEAQGGDGSRTESRVAHVSMLPNLRQVWAGRRQSM